MAGRPILGPRGTATSTRAPRAASGLQVHEVLPAVHRVFSLVKCWLMGTMKCLPSPEHVQANFDEWVFPVQASSAAMITMAGIAATLETSTASRARTIPRS